MTGLTTPYVRGETQHLDDLKCSQKLSIILVHFAEVIVVAAQLIIAALN